MQSTMNALCVGFPRFLTFRYADLRGRVDGKFGVNAQVANPNGLRFSRERRERRPAKSLNRHAPLVGCSVLLGGRCLRSRTGTYPFECAPFRCSSIYCPVPHFTTSLMPRSAQTEDGGSLLGMLGLHKELYSMTKCESRKRTTYRVVHGRFDTSCF